MNNIYFYLGFLIIPFIGFIIILMALSYANNKQKTALLKIIEASNDWLKR